MMNRARAVSFTRSSHRSSSARTARGLAAHAGATVEHLEPRQMLAADPITNNHPLWFAQDIGKIRFDGNLTEKEWGGVPAVVRTQAHDPNSRVTLRMKHTSRGLALGIDVRDDQLWADGNGNGSGERWEFWQDDAIALFFDPANTRARNLPESGRLLAFNIAGMNAPLSGSNIVNRYEYLKGDGKGAGQFIYPAGGLEPGLIWKVRINGTLNDNKDVDVGWTAEVMIPWSALGMKGRPKNGQTIGMNFEVFFDNDGGLRTWDYFGQDPDPQKRLGPLIVDDHLNAVFSSYNNTDTGWQGPTNYAYVQFVQRSAKDRPKAIQKITANAISGYGVRLDFRAPAGSMSGKGHVAGYEIRYSLQPIKNQADWSKATVVENNFTPHLKGQKESLRLGGLSPSTTYYFAVRPYDLAGRLGLMRKVSFTTLSAEEDPSGGGRILVSPEGNTLMTESGEPFIMIGGTVGVSNLYVRSLYSGLIYRPGDGAFVNFSNGVREGDAAGYFDALAEYGLNTLRVQLEWTKLEKAGRTQLPAGFRWLEWREPGDTQSTFNPDMRLFLHRMMEQAARTGIRFVLQTFNNFNYRSNFELTPFAKVNGGPIDDMNDFYWSPEVLAMAKRRVEVLADWVRQSPYAHTVIGFELLNEWDGHDTNRDLVTELRQRSWFHVQLANHLRAHAPEINVMSASINLAPRGPVGRILYYSDAFDILDPHYYTSSVAEPVFNKDSDKSVRPARDYGALAAYWLTNRRDSRPVHNGEWDVEPRTWPGGQVYYTDLPEFTKPRASHPFYLSDDEGIFRAVNWVSIASGLAGGGFRIGRTTLVDTYPQDPRPETTGYLPLPLTLGMREIQKSVRAFVDSDTLGFDWNDFQGVNLSGLISAAGSKGDRLLAWGSVDADQGLAYVLRDAAKSNGDAKVSGAKLRIEGLKTGKYDVEFWSTGPDATIIGTLTGVRAPKGISNWAMPDFTTDVMVKFRKTT